MTVQYERGLFKLSNLTKLRGSAAVKGLPLAIACGVWALVLWKLKDWGALPGVTAEPVEEVMTNNAPFTTYSACIIFLVVFRSKRAYNRYLKGTLHLKKKQSELFITASNLIAFTRAATAEKQVVKDFQHKLIRLLSMLHAVCLHQLEFGGEGVDIRDTAAPTFPMIGGQGLDGRTIEVLQQEECRVEIILQWIQSLTVDGIKSGVCTIPPPILSRIFQNLSNGLTQFYSAYRVTEVPFPFPFVQLIDYLVLFTCVMTPIPLQSFCRNEAWAFTSTFVIVLVLISLNCIAVELENPFSQTVNNVDLVKLQKEFNKRLVLLIKPQSSLVPTLSDSCLMEYDKLKEENESDCGMTFEDIWNSDIVDAAFSAAECRQRARSSSKDSANSKRSSRGRAPSKDSTHSPKRAVAAARNS
eukprot:TRINITY_DN24589_c0_g1_i1.p1 TRINITY_DN24589_c0_g1~~TRINITY_DN24589_c0_g1_i1.p1  ORF type:complete len:413 (+),score=73.96 TRINITY_DN24589_c0_g1_i1:149-1387(+)